MKGLLFSALVIAGMSAPAFADTLDQRVSDLEARVRLLERVVSGGNGGGHGHEPVTVTSKVDTTCLDRLYQSITGHPTVEQAIDWTSRCRTAPANQPGCATTSSLSDAACYSKIDSYVTGRMSADQAMQVEAACKVIELSCRK